MIKRIIFLFFLLLNIQFIYSAEVLIDVEVFKTHSVFDYSIIFNENETYNSFSFEKPFGSSIVSALDKYGNEIIYSIAGSYYIFRPEEISNNTFNINLISTDISKDIIEKNTFANYVNFNFPVENLIYSIKFSDDFTRPDELFPRNYIITSEGEYVWELINVDSDTFFLINFRTSLKENQTIFDILLKYSLILFILLPFTVLFLIILILWKKNYFEKFKKKNNFQKNSNFNEEGKRKYDFNKVFTINIDENQKNSDYNSPLIINKNKINGNNLDIKNNTDNNKSFDNENIIINQGIENNILDSNVEKKKDNFKDFINKYLTENEKEVVEIVKKNDGISQYDILNYLPSLTKSNLSKIITKLDNKKILNRIKVGKVNKIYLGEKLNIEDN